MKLDMDLVRAILLQAEAAPPNQFPKIELPEYPEDAITEHIQLLAERGLLDAAIAPSGFGSKRIATAFVRRLTWQGHEFLQNAKNEQVWERTKRFIKDKGGTVSFELFKDVLMRIASQHLGLSP